MTWFIKLHVCAVECLSDVLVLWNVFLRTSESCKHHSIFNGGMQNARTAFWSIKRFSKLFTHWMRYARWALLAICWSYDDMLAVSLLPHATPSSRQGFLEPRVEFDKCFLRIQQLIKELPHGIAVARRNTQSASSWWLLHHYHGTLKSGRKKERWTTIWSLNHRKAF